MFEEARSLNQGYRDSIPVELEALVRWIAGDFRGSLAKAREAVAWVPVSTRRRAFGMVFGGLSAIELGRLAEAEELLARAREVVREHYWQFFPPMTQWGEAVLAWRDGRAPDCVAILRPAIVRLLETQSRFWAAMVLFDLAEASADAGDPAAAATAAADLNGVAEFVRLPMFRGVAAGASSCASLVAGDPERAVELALDAIELLSTTDCAAHLARAHYLLGRSLPARRRPEAVEALQRSASILEQCGSPWRRGRSLDALRRLGSAGGRAAAALGPGSLTRRERKVARLAATGMSAKEIAQALFVGERTVESHLASVYAKLVVDSRLHLVRRAGELGVS